jgi:hypothetical protein
MNPLKKVSIILSLFLISSCAEDLDFNQLDDYVFKPVFTSALTYFTVLPFQFFDSNGIQQNSREDITEFDLFQDNTIIDNVVKMVFNAEFKNEFDRDVHIEIEFLTDNNLSVYAFTPVFVESRDTNPPPYEAEIIFATNPDIFRATKVRIRASLENVGTPMNPFDTAEFELKSSITLFVQSDL